MVTILIPRIKKNYEVEKVMKFNIKQKGLKSPRDESVMRLIESPAILASGFSTVFLLENPDDICDKVNLLLQEKQTGNNPNIIDEEIIVMADKLLQKTNAYLLNNIDFYNLDV